MENLVYFILGIIFSCILYNRQITRKERLRKKIDELDAYIEYIEKQKKYPERMYISAFMQLFFVLGLICIALLMPNLFIYLSLPLSQTMKNSTQLIAQYLSLLAYLGATVLAFIGTNEYKDLLHYEKSMERKKRKKESLMKKIENT